MKIISYSIIIEHDRHVSNGTDNHSAWIMKKKAQTRKKKTWQFYLWVTIFRVSRYWLALRLIWKLLSTNQKNSTEHRCKALHTEVTVQYTRRCLDRGGTEGCANHGGRRGDPSPPQSSEILFFLVDNFCKNSIIYKKILQNYSSQ
jgi:hypothetical protein